MRKIMTKNERFESRGWRFLAAASLAMSLAAFGCTTNRYPGNGQPTSVSPSYGPVSHSVTPGSSSGTEGVPPMASSYTGVPRVNTDALAILAAEQGFRGRVLGPANPSGMQTEAPVQPTGGQFVSPSMIANPQSTVNSSISSSPTPVITGGPVGAGVVINASATTTPLATNPTSQVAGSTVFAPLLMNSTQAPAPTSGTATTQPIRIETNSAGQITVTNVKPGAKR